MLAATNRARRRADRYLQSEAPLPPRASVRGLTPLRGPLRTASSVLTPACARRARSASEIGAAGRSPGRRIASSLSAAAHTGQVSSVRLGLQALSPNLDAIIVAPADMPLIDAQDIVALIGAYKKRGDASMVAPRVRSESGEAEPGNPVIFDASLRTSWLAGEADLACRKWRSDHPEQVRWFDTDNRRYRIDIDTPDDLQRFAAETGHALRWPASIEHT